MELISGANPAGFLLINKPEKISSYDVIRYIQKLIGTASKISHMGTLDPFASGLLIIAISKKATQQSQNFLILDKEYRAVGKLGELTDTLDYTGTIVETYNQSVSKENLKNSIESLIGGYEQIPPIFSALKYRGRPLYKLARSKKGSTPHISSSELQNIVRTKTKFVKIYELELKNYNYPFFEISTQVSHGTYIRSLINDIARRSGSCATTYELVRTKIGPYSLEQAVSLYSLKTLEDIRNNLIELNFKPSAS